ncbi:MAG: hypothetical protein WDA09_10425, partial [Bacteriovoracaceae bacterium]
MKIHSFWIKNFMSWEEEVFKLSSNVTIFAGVSDKGKSAIMNAFEWLRTNRPLGDEFVSDWAKKKKKDDSFTLTDECEFGIVFSDGIKLSRAKGPNCNEYRISTLDKPLKAVGNGPPPDEVLQLLNLSDINIQNQGDPHFLVGDSPPEIGRKLNQIASLSDIDIAFKNADTEIRATKADIKKEEAVLSRSERALKEYDWLSQAEIALKKCERLLGELSATRNEEHKLRTALNEALEYERQIKKHQSITAAKASIEKLFELKTSIQKLDDEVESLTDKEDAIKAAEEEILNAGKITAAKKDIEDLLSLRLSIENLQKEIKEMIAVEDKYFNTKDKFDEAEDTLRKMKAEYKRIKPKQC